MPVVQVNVWSGITFENKKKIVEGITKVLEDIGIPSQAITIIIAEEPKGELGFRRQTAFRSVCKHRALISVASTYLSIGLPLLDA
jgi:4-oxalocrotonate tautomerase family enzyme